LSHLVAAFRKKDTLKKAKKDTLKKAKKAYKDAGIRWTFDVEKAKAELAKRRKSSASRQTHDADTGSDCSSDGYALTAAYFSQPLQSNAASSLHDRSLQNRWVIDPGSNVHICNRTGVN
jgi:hypothetical protein